MKKESLWLKWIIGIALGVGLNIATMSLFQKVLNLPLFMDTTGSIAVTFVLGGIPGLICALVTEFLLFYVEHYISWIVCLYGFTVWAAVGIVAVINPSIRKAESKISVIVYLVIISILMALAVSIVGGIVNSIDDMYVAAMGMKGEVNSATSFFKDDLLKIGVSSLLSNIFSRIPGNLVERPITTFMGYGILKLYQFISEKIAD